MTTPETTNAAEAERDFLSGGFARPNYPASATWQRYFELLAPNSDRFVKLAWSPSSLGYAWPLDALRWWSRMWEYPFIASQLTAMKAGGKRLLDVGAAVTFFTHHLQREGFDITNLDYDSAMSRIFDEVFKRVSSEFKSASPPPYIIGDARETGLPDAGFNIVLCTSVLEHIPQWQRAAREFCRLVAPGGHLILTLDVRLDDQSNGLPIEELGELHQILRSGSMQRLTREESSIPPDALVETNAPHPTRHYRSADQDSLLRRLWPPHRLPTKLLRRLTRMTHPPKQEHIAIYGGTWRKQA